ncbi:MAG: D-2-hydroxyacid dehydrogenase [Ruminococcaceae bacterium]|nr:D-2-hydroxyacid dehydrogenase [Oscillospiraceae bacterium]
MNIVVLDTATVADEDVSLAFLSRYGQVTAYYMSSQEEVPSRIREAELVLINKVHLGEAEMAAAPHLKYIGLFATGYNNVDLDAARRRGITVCNVPGYSTEAVAQHTVALMLEHFNRVADYHRSVTDGDWVHSETFCYSPIPLAEVHGKTLGIVGYGAIGRRVADIARAFGMSVLVYARRPLNEPEVEQVPFRELLERSDVVSLHCPLNADSADMMDEAAFAAMKPGALFINTARGGLVDEQALRRALESGHLGGAALDVLRQEPMAADCPLLGAPRCIITPHVAWAAVDTRRRLVGIVEENIRAFLDGSPINNVVKG